ncbi:MAG TPA: MFS transporter, partial [Acidimicrobiales bacterium]|nr:MFS transporter [Acidimicrobiales bacterium]
MVRLAVKYGWVPLAALAATNALGAGEVASLSQAVDGIQRTFHVSDATVSLLPVSLSVVGVLGAIPFGFMADRRRRTLVLAAAMLAWTACMGLNGLAWSFGVLLAFRLGVGFVEASGSASISLLGDYFPVEKRAGAMGWYSSGAIVGTLIGFVGAGAAVSIGGWRWAFWFWVPFGVAVAIWVATRPEPHRGAQDADFEAIRAATVSGVAGAANEAAVAFAGQLPAPRRVGTVDYRTADVKTVVRELLRIRSMWWALLSLTVAQCMASALSFWAIPFFKRVDHMSSV